MSSNINYIPFDMDKVHNKGADAVKILISDKLLIFNLKTFKTSDRYFIDIYDQSFNPILKNIIISSYNNIVLGLVDDRLPSKISLLPIAINENGVINDLKVPFMGKNYLLAVIKEGG